MYLAWDSKLWWKIRVQEVISGGRPMIDKLVVLNKELRAQFLPCNVAWLAREALKNLKQVGSVRDYVKAFHNDKKKQGGKKHSNNRTVKKRKEIGIASDGAKGKKHNDKKKFSGCFLCQCAHRVKDCPRRKNLNAIVTERERGAKEGSNLQVSPMVLLNSLRVIPPEDLLGEDAIEQLVLEVIEVFVNVFVMEPLEIFIDASLVHKEDELWVSSSIDSIIMDAILGRNSENLEAKEELQWVDELMVESKAEIIAVSSDDEEESMVKSKMEVILIELSDEGSMEETNGEVVQEEPRDVQMSEGAKELSQRGRRTLVVWVVCKTLSKQHRP
ncbi:hypothetical protein GBA52_026953 [Prunus armeniaca]|nr:hypothetical protein GBA52_026953 [Prunus armeniaca]